jgi:hypothetical protein
MTDVARSRRADMLIARMKDARGHIVATAEVRS